MATADTLSGDEWVAHLRDDIGLAKQPAAALTDELGSEDELVSYLVNGNDLSNISGIGQTSSSRIWAWFEEEHPESDRQRRLDDEAYATEFVVSEEGEDSDEFRFAFVCPRCDSENPLKGDPAGFRNRPFRCVECNWVPVLDAEFLGEFRDEHYTNE